MERKWKVSEFVKFCVGVVIGFMFVTAYFKPEWVRTSNDFIQVCAGVGMLYIVARIFKYFENR